MKSAEKAAVKVLGEALGRLGDLGEAKVRVLEAFCLLADAACGQLIDNLALLKNAKVAEAIYADPRQITRAEFDRMQEAYRSLIYPDDFESSLKLYAYVDQVLEHSKSRVARQLRDSGFYRKFMNPFRLTDGCSIFLREDARPCRFTMGISTRNPSGFSERHVNNLKKFAPIAGKGLENLAFWLELSSGAAPLESAIKSSSEMLVMLDRKRKGSTYAVRAASRAAAQVLAPEEAANKEENRLTGFLKHAPHCLGVTDGTAAWQPSNGRAFRVHTLRAGTNGNAEVLLVRMERSPEPPMRDLRAAAERHSLTSREADVFVQLAQGKSNKEIAHALGLSYDTARAHVRNLFEKLGVTSRIEAINVVRNG